MVKQSNIFARVARALRLAEPTESADQGSGFYIPRNMSAQGSSGTEIYSGYYAEEYLQSLRGSSAAEVYDKMARSDANVTMCLGAVKNPILSASWEVEPADDTPEAKDDADFISHILFEAMDKPFADTLEEILTCIDHGHSVLEVVHKVVLDDPAFGSFIGIRELGYRSQKTIERWNLDAQTERLRSITQYAYGDLGRQVDIAGENLLVFTLQKRGANFEGVSMLRPCYGPYMRKNAYQKIDAIGIERTAIKTPKLKVPNNKFNSDEYNNAIEALKKYNSHECNFITFPEGWELELIGGDYDPEKVRVAIDSENKEMVFAFLANFLLLGQSGNGGAYALGRDLSDFFLGGLMYIVNKVCGRVNHDLIKPLIIMNRGKRAKYPLLKACGVDDKAGKEFGELLSMLVNSQMITPDDRLEENLRKRLGIPKMSTEGQRKKLPPASPFGGPAGPGNDPNAAPKQFSERTIMLAETPRSLIRSSAADMREFMQTSLKDISRDLVDQIIGKVKNLPDSQKINAKDAAAPRGALAYKSELVRRLASTGTAALAQVRKEVPAAKNVKLDEFDRLPKDVQRKIESQADLIADSQMADIKKAIFFQFDSSLTSTDSLKLLESDLLDAAAKYYTGASIIAGAGNVISLVVNDTRNTFLFDPEVSDEIESYEFVNPDPQSPICMDLAGTVFKKDDPEAARYYPPLHHNCESYLVPILKGSRRARDPDPTGLKPSDPALEKFITLSEVQRCGCH